MYCQKNTKHAYCFKKRVKKVMVNNSTKINKTDNHLSLQMIEHKKGNDKLCWKLRSKLGTGT